MAKRSSVYIQVNYFSDTYVLCLDPVLELITTLLGVIMAQQYIINAYLKRFEEMGQHTVISNLARLHYMETFAILDAKKINKKDRADNLESLMFLA